MSNQEHILVCLSASPSNAKIIRTAARMASAFGGAFTALYVQTPEAELMSEEDKERLQSNIHLAGQLGADIATVYGTEVSYQIAEFARISGISKIVIGRSSVKQRHFWGGTELTERLTQIAPGLDIYIIPDAAAESTYHARRRLLVRRLIPSLRDMLVMSAILTVITAAGAVFLELDIPRQSVMMIYILGVQLISLMTTGYACGVIGSVLSVCLFNFFLTEPRLTFHAYDSGYPVTFAIMLACSIITGTLASKLKEQARLSAQTAFRTKVLLDTSQLLQKAQSDRELLCITAGQIVKLLDRDVMIYPVQDGVLGEGSLFGNHQETGAAVFSAEQERAAAQWVLEHKKRAGATTEIMNNAACLYLAIRISGKVFGVVGIALEGRAPEAFENSVLLSILGECALAMENSCNAREKEQAAVRAKNEQLRADLLRMISHDLRTPLTSISGNAGNLLANDALLDTEARAQICADILDDAQWLNGLVENLLSVTRIEDGRMNLELSPQLMEEVIEEALCHVHRKGKEHIIETEYKEDLLLARMDARLIIQVVINLVDNAVKYTPAGSRIRITAQRRGSMIAVIIADNGPGIPDSEKSRVFDMFVTGERKTADGRRSLGLGLALCRTIITAHGGTITLTDNKPHGCVFTFTLPQSEVTFNE